MSAKVKKGNKQFDPEAIFGKSIKALQKEQYSQYAEKPIDILTFAKDVLKVNLYDAQKIILKFFYKNSRHNEHLEITEEDISIIKSWSMDQHWIFNGEHPKLSMLQKDKTICRDLVLVLGRRSGKSFLSSLISVYEAYKLICLPDPQKFYGTNADIYIINVAVNADQAKTIIFKQISRFVNSCPFFDERIGKEIEDEIRILSDADMEMNKDIRKRKVGKIREGSIIIKSGNSNSPALRGKDAIMVIYDEIAHFTGTEGGGSASEAYNALSRSVATFVSKGDGKNIVISTPAGQSGFFYKHYRRSMTSRVMQMFQIPTKDANPTITNEYLEDEKDKEPGSFDQEFGAKFLTGAKNPYFPPKKTEEAFEKREDLYRWTKGNRSVRGFSYFMHIDPATSSDNWAILIAHPEYRHNSQINKTEMHVVQDYSFFWKPPPGGYLDPDEIMDDHIIPLFKTFSIVSVTFDAMFSLEQQKKLKGRRIAYRQISFSGRSKNELYDTLRDFFIGGRIELCLDDGELRGELNHVIVDYTRTPPRLSKDRESDFPNDDLVDCLAGVTHSMSTGAAGITRLPRIVTVHTGSR